MDEKTSFCEIKTKPSRTKPLKTCLYAHKGNCTWKSIKTEKYKTAPDSTWQNAVRMVLIGGKGEKAGFHLRYFEIAQNGSTSLERHRHEHVVIGIRGNGVCALEKKTYKVGFLDTLYIEPEAPHQFRNPFKEPFGFFCIVDAKRDKPRVIRK